MEVASVLIATAGLGVMGFVGSSFARSSEGLEVLVDSKDSNVESVFVIPWKHIYC